MRPILAVHIGWSDILTVSVFQDLGAQFNNILSPASKRKATDQRQAPLIFSLQGPFLKVTILLSFHWPEPNCLAMMQGILGNVVFILGWP